jgi:hypothetical protein
LRLQQWVFRLGRAVQVVPAERLSLLTFGGQQGNRHVHWHVAALAPGVAYADQQMAALSMRRMGCIASTLRPPRGRGRSLDVQRPLHPRLLVTRLATDICVRARFVYCERGAGCLTGRSGDLDWLRDTVGNIEVVR